MKYTPPLALLKFTSGLNPRSIAGNFSDLQSANFNHHLPCREQLQRLSESFIEHYLQPAVGDIAAGHPYQLRGRPVTGNQLYKIAVFADNDDALLLSSMKYFCIGSITQAQCSQRKRFDMKLLGKPCRK